MNNLEQENEYRETLSKLLSGEKVNFTDKDYTMFLEKTSLYKAIVYKNKKNDEIVKKIIDISVDTSFEQIIDNYLLPIGSVVCVDDLDYMIISRFMYDEKEKYDYVAVKFPVGLIGNETFNFNQNNIERIKFVGYEDEENASLTIAIKNQMDMIAD